MGQCEVVAGYQKHQLEQQRLGERIKVLREKYTNFKDIPPELLLSITAEQVEEATQKERDEFYRLQIKKFGRDDKIPTSVIASRNTHILVRREKRTKSGSRWYLALAEIAKDGSTRPSGTKYWYE